jgi:hypothetical protein
MAGAVLVRPADELHRRTLWRVTIPANQANCNTFVYLEIVANAVLQRSVGGRATHQSRDGAPQRRPIGPNKRKPDQTAPFNTQKQFQIEVFDDVGAHERLMEARKVEPPMDCSGWKAVARAHVK